MLVTTRTRLFGVVMFWTAVTSIFAWLPLVRIIGRPDGYQWAILGLSGAGTSGPYWIFIGLTAYVVVMLFAAFRLPRAVCYPMLLLWHTVVTAVVAAGVLQGGAGATLQGQGLRFSFSLWMLLVPCVAGLALAVVWIVADRRAGGLPAVAPWSRPNTVRLVASLAVLMVALALFRAGTNYNWVTAAAIVATVVHWILLVESFAASGGPAPQASGADAVSGAPWRRRE